MSLPPRRPIKNMHKLLLLHAVIIINIVCSSSSPENSPVVFRPTAHDTYTHTQVSVFRYGVCGRNSHRPTCQVRRTYIHKNHPRQHFPLHVPVQRIMMDRKFRRIHCSHSLVGVGRHHDDARHQLTLINTPAFGDDDDDGGCGYLPPRRTSTPTPECPENTCYSRNVSPTLGSLSL